MVQRSTFDSRRGHTRFARVAFRRTSVIWPAAWSASVKGSRFNVRGGRLIRARRHGFQIDNLQSTIVNEPILA
jgi:hypothetical protein